MSIVITNSKVNYGPNVVTDGLVLYLDAANSQSYPGTGLNWYDLSENENTGSLNAESIGTTTSGVMNFNGTSNYIDTPYGANVNPYSTPLSTNIWVNPSTIGTNMMFLSTGQSRGNGDTNQRFYLSIYNGYWDWGIRTSSWSSGDIAANTFWNMITIVIDSDAKFYLNGSHIYTKSINDTYVLNAVFRIGAHDSNYYFQGNIRNLQIYNKGLTQSEITQNYNAQKSRFGL